MNLFLNILLAGIGVIMGLIAIITQRKVWLRSLSTIIVIPLASASSPNKQRSKAEVCIPHNVEFIADDQPVDVNQYKELMVDGESMQTFGINDGDVVLVNTQQKPFADTEIILLKVHPNQDRRIEYKLRKFIQYDQFEDVSDFEKWIKEYNPALEYNREQVQDKIKESKKLANRLVISQTMAKRKPFLKRVSHCSVHLEKDVAGIVQYRIPREKVKVLDKI